MVHTNSSAITPARRCRFFVFTCARSLYATSLCVRGCRGMDLICDERPSDSIFVERIWRSHSEHAGHFLSMADSHWGMVVTKHRGRTILTVRGPETRATPA